MAGYEVRGGSPLGQWKWPLYTLWSLADAQGDIRTKIKVNNIVERIASGSPYQHWTEAYERWVARYLHGHQ